MDIQYRSHTFQVAECDLIVMGDNFYAKVDLGQRGLSYPHYIKVTPPVVEAHNFDSGLLYDQPQPDLRTLDNILALTEVLGSRDPERQKSRDLYTYQLYCDIADTVAA